MFGEVELPGVGKRYELTLSYGGKLILIHHIDGSVNLYYSETKGDERPLFTLNEEEAKLVASLLTGAIARPAPLEKLEAALTQKAAIQWFRIPAGSSVVGKRIEELDIRKKTEASIIAITRNDITTPNPSPQTQLMGGDIVIAIGGPESMRKLSKLLEQKI